MRRREGQLLLHRRLLSQGRSAARIRCLGGDTRRAERLRRALLFCTQPRQLRVCALHLPLPRRRLETLDLHLRLLARCGLGHGRLGLQAEGGLVLRCRRRLLQRILGDESARLRLRPRPRSLGEHLSRPSSRRCRRCGHGRRHTGRVGRANGCGR